MQILHTAHSATKYKKIVTRGGLILGAVALLGLTGCVYDENGNPLISYPGVVGGGYDPSETEETEAYASYPTNTQGGSSPIAAASRGSSGGGYRTAGYSSGRPQQAGSRGSSGGGYRTAGSSGGRTQQAGTRGSGGGNRPANTSGKKKPANGDQGSDNNYYRSR